MNSDYDYTEPPRMIDERAERVIPIIPRQVIKTPEWYDEQARIAELWGQVNLAIYFRRQAKECRRSAARAARPRWLQSPTRFALFALAWAFLIALMIATSCATEIGKWLFGP